MVLLPRRDACGMARSSPPVPVPVAHSPASRLQRLIRDRDAGESVVTFHQPLESISTLRRSSKGHDDLLNPWCANPMYGSTPVQIPFSKQTNPNLVVSREEATSGNTAPRWTNPKGNNRKKTSAVIGCKSKGKKKVIAARRLVCQRKVDSDAAAEGGKRRGALHGGDPAAPALGGWRLATTGWMTGYRQDIFSPSIVSLGIRGC